MTGTGVVNSVPAGISCGSTCSASLVTNSQVTLTASPSGSASFSGWSGTGAPAACTTGTPRTCTVTMSAAKSVSATFTVAPAVGSPAALYVYKGSGQLAATSTAFANPLQVLVTDANGSPVPGATVSLAAVPIGGASATLSAGTATTNASGIASVTATANATPGTYTVSAILAALTPAVFTLTNVGPPASITYVNGGNGTDPQLAPISTAFAASLVALVKDASGNVVPGATVTYTSVPVAGASATISGVTVTDAAGMSSATATANATIGAYTVTASLAGVATPAVFSLQNISTGPAAVFVVSGSPQIAPLSTLYGSPLVVAVGDAAGNALSGVTVTFAAPITGASATLSAATAVTDASGLASITATANATGGPVAVAASVAGVATPATFNLTNDGGYSIAVNGGGIQTTTINAAFGSALSALVWDTVNDVAVAGATVTFLAPSSGPSATLTGGSACSPASSGCRTASTDASGLASINAIANGLSGTYAVTASTPNAPSTAAFTLTNQCTESTQCGGTTPVCGGSAACVACSSDADCGTKDASKPYCDVTGACFACTTDAQCGGTTPICSQGTNACGGCTTDAQCANKNPGAPTCVVATGACSASYSLTASAGANGTISPSGAQTVASGGTQGFTIAPAAGYHVADVLVDGSSVGAVTSYTFSNVTASHTIAASFGIDTHTITASSGLDGLISPVGPISVNQGASQSFTITALAHHHVADVIVDGSSVGAVTSYTFSNVTASHTVVASFAIDTDIITATAGAHGTISPTGGVSVDYGADQSFTVVADASYMVADVLVDGSSVGAVTSYAFSGVTAPHTIDASFVVSQLPATVIIDPASLSTTYDGTPKAVTVTTIPAGRAVAVTCAGSATAPTNAGTYAVVATVTDPNYVGSATASLVIAKAIPTITWGNPAAITYGAPLGATQLNATASVPGTLVYTAPAGTVLNAGSGQILSVAFTPTDGTNYSTASASVTITVNKAAPTITWANPAAITYGAALGATQLNATTSVPGTLVYTPPAGTVLNAGAGQSLSVAFTPTDATNYSTASASVMITVNKATPTITWGNPAAINYGAVLSATQLNATASVPGTLVYTPPAGTVLNAGSGQTLSVAFTPTDGTNYSTASASVTITVNKATPTITWANPATITYDAALSATQLNATASVPGTLVYTPPAGTVLGAGSGQSLSVAFTPTDSTNYSTASASVTITVNRATPTITVTSSRNPSRRGWPVVFTVSVSSPSATPSGTVTFKDGEIVLGTGTLANGTAQLTVRSLVKGTHTISVAYDGTADLAAASAAVPGGEVIENTPPVAGSGTALTFDGVTRASIDASGGTLDVVTGTVELWTRAGWTAPEAVQGTPSLITLGDGDSLRFGLSVAPDRQHLIVRLGTTDTIVSAALDDGAWHHLALVSDGGHLGVFLDAALLVSVDGGFAGVAGKTLTIGDGLVGEMDEVRVWSNARDVAALAADLRRPLKGDEPGLLAYWRMDEGQGREFFDAGPNHLDGQVTMASATPADATPFIASGAWRYRRVVEDGDLSAIAAGYDADGDPLTLTVTTAAQHGQATADQPDLQVEYHRTAKFLGNDEFAFTLADGDGSSSYTVDVMADRILACRADADCGGGEVCLQGTCTAPSQIRARASGVGCSSGGGGMTLVGWLLALALLARRRARHSRSGGSVKALRVALVLPLAFLAREASAQTLQGFALQTYEPAPAGDRFFVVPDATVEGHLRPAAAVTFSWAAAPLVLDRGGSVVPGDRLVHRQSWGFAGGSLAIADKVLVDLVAPVALYQSGSKPFSDLAQVSASAFGDLRLGARVPVAVSGPVTLAAAFDLWVPTGTRDAFTSDGSVRLMPKVIAGAELRRLSVGAELGFLYRQSRDLVYTQTGSAIAYAAAASYRWGEFRVGPELYGRYQFEGSATSPCSCARARGPAGSGGRAGAAARARPGRDHEGEDRDPPVHPVRERPCRHSPGERASPARGGGPAGSSPRDSRGRHRGTHRREWRRNSQHAALGAARQGRAEVARRGGGRRTDTPRRQGLRSSSSGRP